MPKKNTHERIVIRQHLGTAANMTEVCQAFGFDDFLLGSDAAARFLGVDVAKLDQLSAQHESLRPIDEGGRLQWRRGSLADYLEATLGDLEL